MLKNKKDNQTKVEDKKSNEQIEKKLAQVSNQEKSSSKNLVIYEAFEPGKNISNYIQKIHKIPILTQQEEYDLATRYQKNGDVEAARKLIISHLRFVVFIARNFFGYGLPKEDIIQEGNIGLMRAVKKFDPDLGVRLISFAVYWIKAYINEYVLKNKRIVKIATTRAQRKLFFKLKGEKKTFDLLTDDEATEIAKKLNVKKKEVLEMDRKLLSSDSSFEVVDDENSNLTFAPKSYLADKTFNPELMYEKEKLTTDVVDLIYEYLEKIDDRTKDIIYKRWLSDEKATLESLAQKYEVSIERIRQIEKNAFNKLKKKIQQKAISIPHLVP